MASRFTQALIACLLLFVAAPVPPPAAASPAPAAPNAAAPALLNTALPATSPGGAKAGIPEGTPVEVPGLRTATSRTYRVGTHDETQFFARPVNYQDSKGVWQPVDDSLVADATPGSAYTAKADAAAVHLPPSLSVPVRVGLGGASIAFALVGAGGTASVKGATATYASALPGVDVAYTAASDRLKEDLILHSAAAAHTFTFTLQATGVTAKANARGGIDFVDAAGKVQLSFAAPTMRDASGKPAARSAPVTLKLGAGAAGQTVTLAADPTWLADPARVWPVTIDPTVYYNALTFTGDTADCFIASNQGNNYCGQSELYAGYDASSIYHSLLEFDLHAYSLGLPHDAVVLEASLSLYLANKDISGTALPIELRQVTQPWTVAATWNTTDGSTPWTTPGGTFTSTPVWTTSVGPTTGQRYTWYLTSLVQGWHDGTAANDGLLLKSANESTVDWVGFDSDETTTDTSYWPTLTVKWEEWEGAKPYYTLNTYPLTDRMGLAVNVGDGNLMLRASDLAIAGTGLPLSIDRIYNNVSVLSWDVGNSWALDTGSDIELVLNGNGQGDGADIYGADWGVFFPRNPDGSFGSASVPTGIDATLAQNPDSTYTLTFHGSGLQYHWPAGGGLMTAQNDKNGNTISYGYNGSGNLVSVTDTQGRTITFDHTSPYSTGLITAMHDPTGRLWQYGYDSNKNLTSYIDPAGKTTTYGYDADNELNQITDPNGNITKLTYNTTPFYRVASVTLAAGTAQQATYSYTYNDTNVVVTDPNNHQTTYYMDYLGRATKVVDALGNTYQWSWTPDSHVSQYTDGKGQPFKYGYDANNMPNQVTLPTGATTSAVYGGVANIPYFYVPTSTTDAQRNVVTYNYDNNGSVKTVTDQLASQNQASATYNANGTVATATGFNGNTTSYGYDAKGNLTGITPPAPLGAITITPDGLSRTQSTLDGKGQRTSYTYDNLDRVTQITYADNSTISYTPDADGNILSMVDNTGTTSYTYDAQNRATQKTLPGNRTIGYTYDPVGNLTSLADAGGAVGYHYNAANLVDTVTEPNNLGQTTFQYDANYRRTSTVYPGSGAVTVTQTYDNSGRLATISAKTGGTQLTSYTYNYQKNGTGADTGLVYLITNGVDNTTTTQQYDALNRLTSWVVTPGTGSTALPHNFQYAYDGNGNRTSINADGVVSTLGYNAANEWTTATSGGKTANYSYDANGNELGNDGFGDQNKALHITYNAKNQTATITDTQENTVPMTYTGPGQGERVTAGWAASNPQTPGGPATYTYGSGLLNVADNTGTVYYTRDPGGALLSQRLPNGAVYHYLVDGDGSVVKLVDPTGAVVATYHYCPTGNDAEPPSGPAAAGNPYRQYGMLLEVSTQTYVAGEWRIDSQSGNSNQPQFCLILGGAFGFFCSRTTAPSTTGQQAQANPNCTTSMEPNTRYFGKIYANVRGPEQDPSGEYPCHVNTTLGYFNQHITYDSLIGFSSEKMGYIAPTPEEAATTVSKSLAGMLYDPSGKQKARYATAQGWFYAALLPRLQQLRDIEDANYTDPYIT